MARKPRVSNSQSASEEVHDFFTRRGFELLKATGFISDSFPDTFAPSAFHDDILKCIRGRMESGDPVQKVGTDWVFRHVDLDRVSTSQSHLSCFQMAVFFSARTRESDDNALRHGIVEQFVKVLCSLGLEPENWLVTYFGGGRIGGLNVPPDEMIVHIWENCGVARECLIPVCGTACFTNCHRPGEPAGPRCEVFVPGVDGNMLEIGTVVFERFMIGSRSELVMSDQVVYGGAIGIERLVMRLAGLSDITKIVDISSLEDLLLAEIDSRLGAVARDHIKGAVDGVRSLVVLRSRVEQLDSKRRRRVNAVARRTGRHLTELGIVDLEGSQVERICRQAAKLIGCSNVVEVVVADLVRAAKDPV